VFNYFFFQNLCHLWDNVKKYGTATEATDDNIRRRRSAFWIPKATDTHSECVILIAFPHQQWLYTRASVLLYTYIVCFVIFALHLQLCFSNGIFPSRLRTENFYPFLIVLTWPCCFPCPYRVPLVCHIHNFCWKVLIVKFLIMQFSPLFNDNLSVKSKCSPASTVRDNVPLAWRHIHSQYFYIPATDQKHEKSYSEPENWSGALHG
jgi:hypothetical protein